MANSAVLPQAPPVPSAFSDSVRSWWSAGEKQSAISEERLLRRLPFFRSEPATTTAGKVTAHSSMVSLSKPKHFLNTLSITANTPVPTAPSPAVLLHGYGAGLGFFFQNFRALSEWAGDRGSAIYALDWLGMGRSARVPFHVKAKREDVRARVTEAESFFIDSLEEWRQRMGLSRMTLVGHSLGAYFSVAYALKYPSRVDRLILLSPAGVPRHPDQSEPERELTDKETMGIGGAVPAGDEEFNTLRQQQHAINASRRSTRDPQSRTMKFITYLWEEGVSPFQIVRKMSLWAPMLIGKYSSRRFPSLEEDEVRDMHDYLLNITLAKGSGEYCISHILAPGAHARWALVDRIDAVKVPVTFVYGDHDWMDPQGGQDSVEVMRKAGNGEGRMYIVKNAGHHVYLDNPAAVNSLIIKELDRMISHDRR
ncbi:alpha/beta-hydrolase [Fistulina hepatica ATCC 64428]|uniref:Alpha/beta-hydrolase n=1 Tax=Fistulina hepatica ATCC 64428 TaxID=1128425 RepID=A0A0D7ARM1_9AGAR|nr:alpha/beta-hydrolase [Fistulina hepatica ATCC 64428]